MAMVLGNAIGGGVDRLVRWVVLPVTGVIPLLVRTGLLFLAFAAMWLGLLAALVTDPARLDSAWRSIGSLPLVVQGVVWLLFLPLMAGLWIWATDWPLVVRVVLILGLAGWNLFTFLPRRESTSPAVTQ